LVNKASLAEDSIKKNAMAMMDSRKGQHLQEATINHQGNEGRMEATKESDSWGTD
jgi:hypothetical protein